LFHRRADGAGHLVGDAELVVDPRLAALAKCRLEIRDRFARPVERYKLASEAAQCVNVIGFDA
jgi:hypothetical protein